MSNSKVMEEGESINLCADGVVLNWENERNIRSLVEKEYPDYKYFRCSYYLLKKF